MKYLLVTIFGCLILFSSASAGDVPSRYISLAPATTEILFALGLDEEIAGVSSYCDYPPEARGKQQIGSFSYPNMELIVALRPDYIFCAGLEQAPAIEQLRRLGLNVYVSYPSDIEGLMVAITEIGSLTQREREAEALVDSMRAQLDEIQAKVSVIPQEARPRVFIEIWHAPLTTAGRVSFMDEIIRRAGGLNIAHDLNRAYSTFVSEEVVRRDPEYIFLAYMDTEFPLEEVKRRVGWDAVSAVKNGKVYNDIDSNILLRPGPRVVEGIRQLYRRMFAQ